MITESKPFFRQLNWNANSSFNVKVDIKENLTNSYHYHPEIELILVKRSAGIRIIGSVREPFSHNDLVLIGKNIPHAFLHEQRHLEKKQKNTPEAIVIQFNENFMGNDFLKLPELKEIKDLFIEARQGLCITPLGKKMIIPIMEKMPYMYSFERMLSLLEILRIITDKKKWRPLINKRSLAEHEPDVNERINKVLNYTFEQYHQDIKIEELASIVSMTKESFCRYFKTQTHKTYLEFLIEFRISKACKMIQENEMSIKAIGFSCGFNSLSNFHYQFKKIMKLSPLDYKLRICENNQPLLKLNEKTTRRMNLIEVG